MSRYLLSVAAIVMAAAQSSVFAADCGPSGCGPSGCGAAHCLPNCCSDSCAPPCGVSACDPCAGACGHGCCQSCDPCAGACGHGCCQSCGHGHCQSCGQNGNGRQAERRNGRDRGRKKGEDENGGGSGGIPVAESIGCGPPCCGCCSCCETEGIDVDSLTPAAKSKVLYHRNQARLIFELPEDAFVYLSGQLMCTCGAKRTFIVPVLDQKAEALKYDIMVDVVRGGKKYYKKTTIDILRAGAILKIAVASPPLEEGAEAGPETITIAPPEVIAPGGPPADENDGTGQGGAGDESSEDGASDGAGTATT